MDSKIEIMFAVCKDSNLKVNSCRGRRENNIDEWKHFLFLIFNTSVHKLLSDNKNTICLKANDSIVLSLIWHLCKVYSPYSSTANLDICLIRSSCRVSPGLRNVSTSFNNCVASSGNFTVVDFLAIVSNNLLPSRNHSSA
jgi:hypothetical protein